MYLLSILHENTINLYPSHYKIYGYTFIAGIIIWCGVAIGT